MQELVARANNFGRGLVVDRGGVVGVEHERLAVHPGRDDEGPKGGFELAGRELLRVAKRFFQQRAEVGPLNVFRVPALDLERPVADVLTLWGNV